MELSGMDGPPEEILGGFAEVVARSSSDLWPLVLSADSSWLRHLKIGYTVYLKIPCIIHDNSHFPHEHCLFDGWIIGPWRTSQVVWRSSRTSACPLWRAKLAAGIATQQPPPVASWAPSPGSRPVARPAQHPTHQGGPLGYCNAGVLQCNTTVVAWLLKCWWPGGCGCFSHVGSGTSLEGLVCQGIKERSDAGHIAADAATLHFGDVAGGISWFQTGDLSNDWLQNRVVNQYLNRRKFRGQTSDNMDRWKAEQGRGREKRKIRREKSRRERVRRKKIQMREKVGKSRFTVFFQWFVAPEGRKVGSLKRRVRSQLARWEMKNCTPLWREAHFEVKMYKTHHCRTNFGSCDVEKVHAVVARSTFWSQNVQNTPGSDHFWKLRCRKSARRCGAKHISKSKCTKHTMYGPLLAVEMLKKCTPLWRRSTFRSQNLQNTTCSRHFWRFRCLKSARLFWREAHLEVKMLKTPGIRTTFGGSDVASLHYTTLHYTTLHYTTLHYTTLHYTTLQLQLHNYTPLH